jgi:uncharacterized protein YndB with AHSA1/START domain
MTADSAVGQVLRDDEGVRLEFVRRYPTSPPDVWSALTDPGRLQAWFGTWSGDPASGSVQVRMTEDPAEQTATIVECRAPSRLVVDLPSPDGRWRLSATLSERDGGTELVFTQRLAEPYDASSIGPGWQYYLDRLGAVLAGQPVPDVWEEYWPALRDAYPLPG